MTLFGDTTQQEPQVSSPKGRASRPHSDQAHGPAITQDRHASREGRDKVSENLEMVNTVPEDFDHSPERQYTFQSNKLSLQLVHQYSAGSTASDNVLPPVRKQDTISEMLALRFWVSFQIHIR